MYQSLLVESLERIDSLQHFYLSELKPIQTKANKGKKLYTFGALMDSYFTLLSYDNEEFYNSDRFMRLKKQVEEYVEILDVRKEKTVSIQFRFKNIESLKERGAELNVKTAAREYRKYADMPKIHGSNTLIMLITRFEEFISKYFVRLFEMFPQRYLDEQTITFSELCKRKDVDEVKNEILNKKVEMIMWDSYEEWLKILGKHSISFNIIKDDLDVLKEMYARRNVLVHNAGVVNDIYLKKIPNSKLSVGTTVFPNKEYIVKAFDTIKTVIIVILIESAKLLSEDRQQYLKDVFNIVFEIFKQKNYSVCKKAYKQLSESKYSDASTKLMSKINYWICIIQENGLQSVKEEIEQLDVSVYDEVYVLAKHILLEEYEDAFVFASQMLKKNAIPAYIFDEWPLFIDFRKTEYYDRLRSAFPSEFKIEMAEIDLKQKTLDNEEAPCKDVTTEEEPNAE